MRKAFTVEDTKQKPAYFDTVTSFLSTYIICNKCRKINYLCTNTKIYIATQKNLIYNRHSSIDRVLICQFSSRGFNS